MSLAKLGTRLFGAKVLINIIKKEDPNKIGKDLGNAFDDFLDRQLGDKKSYQVEKYIIPFIVDLCDSICEQLQKDFKK